MSVTCRIMFEGRPYWKEYAFDFEPRIGDEIALPGEDTRFTHRVERVIHEAREPHSSQLPNVKFMVTRLDWE